MNLYPRLPAIRHVVLRAAGFALCAAPLLAAQQPGKATSLDRSTFEAVKAHMQNGAFADADRLLQPITQLPNADAAQLYLHALVHVLQGGLADADALLGRLRASATPEAAAFVDKIAPVLENARKNSALRDEFADAVRRLDANAAADALARMDVAPAQRRAIGAYIDSYRGRLASALAALSASDLQTLPPNVRAGLRDELAAATGQFRDLSDQLRWYVESSLATSSCQPAEARERSVSSGLLLAEYVHLTALGLQLFPFNERLMDLAFHGAMLSAPYEELQRLGDQILAAKGAIRIPFFSSSARLWLVLNDTTERISLELDPAAATNVNGSEQLGRHQLFGHPYRSVTGIEQRGGNIVSTGSLPSDSFALKLHPSGVAPHYTFMTLVHCLYGEETQKTVTRNLGRFVQHVVSRGGRTVAANLVDPKQITRERLQIFSQIVGTGTVIAATTAENLQRNTAEPNDGRKPMSETLRETAQEGHVLMTRREGLLKMYESVRQSQRDSSRTWANTLGKGALGRALDASSARVEELIDFAKVF